MGKVVNSKTLVTGGAGFIGSNLVEALLKQNNVVTVMDNSASGKMIDLVPFVGNQKFKLIADGIPHGLGCIDKVKPLLGCATEFSVIQG